MAEDCLQHHWTYLEGCIYPLASLYPLARLGTAVLKVLSGQLSSPIPDCSFPSFGQSMIVGVKKCKKHQKRARHTSGWASDRMGTEKRDKIAGPGLNNVDDRNETPIVAHQSSQESYKRPTLSHPKMIPTLTPTLKILLHQTCYPVSP